MLRAYLSSLKNYNVGEKNSNEMFSVPKNHFNFPCFSRENTVCNTSMSYSFGILSQTPTKAEKKGWKLEEEEAERVRAGQQAKGVKRGVNSPKKNFRRKKPLKIWARCILFQSFKKSFPVPPLPKKQPFLKAPRRSFLSKNVLKVRMYTGLRRFP